MTEKEAAGDVFKAIRFAQIAMIVEIGRALRKKGLIDVADFSELLDALSRRFDEGERLANNNVGARTTFRLYIDELAHERRNILDRFLK